ncbi:hypothetical protein Nepgr_001041 [Nepenthes gracilis]|uniref:Uncharacterized protein n=1 Tax=Nepenthes gracilis TaxID=150966 RepID=A0AAD3P4M4_NEPGR|nr:hypothetical protein Nepgr_001041 [Nepenthes gracilis]
MPKADVLQIRPSRFPVWKLAFETIPVDMEWIIWLVCGLPVVVEASSHVDREQEFSSFLDPILVNGWTVSNTHNKHDRSVYEELVPCVAEPSVYAPWDFGPTKNPFEVQLVDDLGTLQNIDNVSPPQRDSMTDETSNGISSGVNRPASGGLIVNCEKRPVLEEVVSAVLEVSDLIHGNMDDPVALTKDLARRESKFGVHVAKQSEAIHAPASFTSLGVIPTPKEPCRPRQLGLKVAEPHYVHVSRDSVSVGAGMLSTANASTSAKPVGEKLQ